MFGLQLLFLLLTLKAAPQVRPAPGPTPRPRCEVLYEKGHPQPCLR